jgi:FKBP-type peptidyl-prolyl cis-trans isomerase FklB
LRTIAAHDAMLAGRKGLKSGVESMQARIPLVILTGAMGVLLVGCGSKLDTTKKKTSYTFGYEVATSLKQRGIDVDTDVFLEGMRDGLTGKKSRLTKTEMSAAVGQFQKEQNEKMAAASTESAKAFRESYLKKKGVKSLPDGILYRVIKQGTGRKPKSTDTVTVNYIGTLTNGKKFDSSYDRGQPATFPLNGVIKGWQEILPMMRTGSKWEVVIPPELAYGAAGHPPVIPPQSTLIFTIDLLSIK